MTCAVSVHIPSGGTIRPGDDMNLRFALAQNSNVIADAGDGDFLAVYDKKLMWRANLYIDEGAGDWNTLHLWTSAQGNDWDVDGNGGQISIKAWTPQNSVVNVTNAVAYSWGCADSPFDFNQDLLDQRNGIQIWYSDANPLWQINQNPHPEWANWASTTAPENNWANYLADLYRPNWALVKHIANTYSPPQDVQLSAGTDCLGFVKRAASYGGLQYGYIFGADDDGRDTIETHEVYNQYGGFDNVAFELGNNITVNVPILNFIVPGDVVTMPGHVAIIDRINYAGGSRTTNIEQIFFIESTTWGDNWHAQKSQSMRQHIQWTGACNIFRLITFDQ